MASRSHSTAITFVSGAVIASVVTYAFIERQSERNLFALKTVIEEKQNELLGYTKYKSYLTQGKDSIAGEAKLITSKVVRPEGETRLVTHALLGVPFDGVVEMNYEVEYSVGYDISPGSYDVRPSATGIEIVIDKPQILARPAVYNLEVKILSGAWPAGVKNAAILMQQQASVRTMMQGPAVAREPAVVALCEKQLILSLSAFLAKQPGVKTVPQITVRYRPSQP